MAFQSGPDEPRTEEGHRPKKESPQVLLTELPGASSVPSVPWSTMCDNPTQKIPGWSFLEDKRTRWPVEGSVWLLDRLKTEKWLGRRFFTQDSHLGGQWKLKAIDSYLRTVARFQEKLSVLVHVAGSGKPPFAFELNMVYICTYTRYTDNDTEHNDKEKNREKGKLFLCEDISVNRCR